MVLFFNPMQLQWMENKIYTLLTKLITKYGSSAKVVVLMDYVLLLMALVSVAAGVLSAFAGSGTKGYADGVGRAVKFDLPCGIAVGPDGIIYVADGGNNRIRKITEHGTNFAI
jgi:DNA-binding beta-propeller fold protein YncE